MDQTRPAQDAAGGDAPQPVAFDETTGQPIYFDPVSGYYYYFTEDGTAVAIQSDAGGAAPADAQPSAPEPTPTQPAAQQPATGANEASKQPPAEVPGEYPPPPASTPATAGCCAPPESTPPGGGNPPPAGGNPPTSGGNPPPGGGNSPPPSHDPPLSSTFRSNSVAPPMGTPPPPGGNPPPPGFNPPPPSHDPPLSSTFRANSNPPPPSHDPPLSSTFRSNSVAPPMGTPPPPGGNPPPPGGNPPGPTASPSSPPPPGTTPLSLVARTGSLPPPNSNPPPPGSNPPPASPTAGPAAPTAGPTDTNAPPPATSPPPATATGNPPSPTGGMGHSASMSAIQPGPTSPGRPAIAASNLSNLLSASGELKSGNIYKLGGKKPFFEWQVRKCVVTTNSKLQYYDPKRVKNSMRGELDLKGVKCERIDSNHAQFARLRKFTLKLSGGKEKDATTSYFSVKPSNVTKTYFFAVPKTELESWFSTISTAESAEQTVKDNQAKLRQQQTQKSPNSDDAAGRTPLSASTPTNLYAAVFPPVQHPTDPPGGSPPKSDPGPVVHPPGSGLEGRTPSVSRHTAPVEIANWQQDFHSQYPGGFNGLNTDPTAFGKPVAPESHDAGPTPPESEDASRARSTSLTEVSRSPPTTETSSDPFPVTAVEMQPPAQGGGGGEFIFDAFDEVPAAN